MVLVGSLPVLSLSTNVDFLGNSSLIVEKTADESSDGNMIAALTQMPSFELVSPSSWCSCVPSKPWSEYAGHHCISATAGQARA